MATKTKTAVLEQIQGQGTPLDPAAKELEPLNVGYLAIARLGQNPGEQTSQARFDEITAGLAARTDDDAKIYPAQLVSARRLFVPAKAK
jgi:hypothetical protein